MVCSLTAPAVLAGQTISVKVDATKTPLKLLRIHLAMPVKPGPLTLYYPKWIPASTGRKGRSQT